MSNRDSFNTLRDAEKLLKISTMAANHAALIMAGAGFYCPTDECVALDRLAARLREEMVKTPRGAEMFRDGHCWVDEGPIGEDSL